MPSPRSERALIVVDWGTSRMRAFLIGSDGATVIERREGPGVGGLSLPAAAALLAVIQPWLEKGEGTRVVLCGMAGSRNGILDVPYAALPAGAEFWVRNARPHRAAGVELLIGAGLCGKNLLGAPDVMRGEEAQIYGAMRLHPSFASGRHICVLPGTHSKWVEVLDGAITRLHTVPTGELFALFRDHSTLLKAGTAEGEAEDGFACGLARSDEASGRVQGAVFEARSAQLLAARSRKWALEFLSGLLIGSEVLQMTQLFAPVAVVTLIGDAELRARYGQAFAAHDVRTHELDGDQCVIAGLRVLASSIQ
jgi:2-dehydro-3-deoxygalactonokinase